MANCRSLEGFRIVTGGITEASHREERMRMEAHRVIGHKRVQDSQTSFFGAQWWTASNRVFANVVFFRCDDPKCRLAFVM